MYSFVKHLPVEYLRFSELSQLLLWEGTSSKYKHLPFWRCQLWGTSCCLDIISINAVPEIYPTFQFLKLFLTLQNRLLNSIVLGLRFFRMDLKFFWVVFLSLPHSWGGQWEQLLLMLFSLMHPSIILKFLVVPYSQSEKKPTVGAPLLCFH